MGPGAEASSHPLGQSTRAAHFLAASPPSWPTCVVSPKRLTVGGATGILCPRPPRGTHGRRAGPRRTATHGPPPQEGNTMDRRLHRTLGIMALVCLLGVSQSWGGPPNNDVTD